MRYFEKIDEQTFHNKLLSAIEEAAKSTGIDKDDDYAWRLCVELTKRVKDDLKVEFDLENFYGPSKDFRWLESFLGINTLDNGMVFCGFCGGRIAADDIFCAHCGSRQPMAGTDSGAALAQARATAKLIVAGTTELDASFLLQKESNLVGRTDPLSNIFPEVDLSRFDPQTKVSRRHARIWREGEAFMVEDLGSVNGTVINDMIRLEPRQPRALDSGDRIRMGETTLHFLVG